MLREPEKTPCAMATEMPSRRPRHSHRIAPARSSAAPGGEALREERGGEEPGGAGRRAAGTSPAPRAEGRGPAAGGAGSAAEGSSRQASSRLGGSACDCPALGSDGGGGLTPKSGGVGGPV